MKGLMCVSICLWISISQADEVAILYTNDIESVYEPIEAHWRDDISLIGGMAHLSSLIREQRAGQEMRDAEALDGGLMLLGCHHCRCG